MDLRPTNPINSGIAAFDAVDRIASRRRDEKRLEEDRTRYRAIEDENLDYARWERGQKKTEVANEELKRKLAAAKLQFINDPKGAVANLDPEVINVLIEDVSKNPQFAMLRNPEGRAQFTQKIQQVYSGVPRQDWNQVIDGLNVVFAHQLNRGTADDGQPATSKAIHRLHPNPDGSVFAELAVTRQDGSTYRAPRTVGGSADPNDMVKRIEPEEVANYLRTMEGIINVLDAKRVSLGDTQPLEEAIKTKQNKGIAAAIQGLDPNASVDQRRQAVIGAAVEAGADINAAVNIANSAVTSGSSKYDERQKRLKGDMVQDEYSLDGGRTWKAFGEPYADDKSGAGPGSGKTTEAEKKAWERYNWLQKKVADLRANLGKETVTQDPYTGEAIKKVITKGDVEVYEGMAKEELALLESMGVVSINQPSPSVPSPQPGSYETSDGMLTSHGQIGVPAGYVNTGKTSGGKPVYENPNETDPGKRYWISE